MHLDDVILVLRLRDLLFDLVQVDVCSRFVAVENLGNLLEGWPVGFDVEVVNEAEFEGVPELKRIGVSWVQIGRWKWGGG